MENLWSGGEVGIGVVRYWCWIGLIGDRGETCLYKMLSLPEMGGGRGMLVAVAEAKKGSWAQNCEEGKLNRDDK